MTSVPQRLKNAFIFGISPLIFFAVLSQSAFAQPTPQSYPVTKLDTEVRFQGADINNGSLGTTTARDAGVVGAEAKAKFTAEFNPDALFYWEGRAVAAAGRAGVQDENTGAVGNNGSFAEWKQSYLQFSNIGGEPTASARIGRQLVAEPYGLWWNQDFDAVRANYDSSLFKGSLTGGQNLMTYRTNDTGGFIEGQKNVARVMAEGSWQYHYQNFIEARVAYVDDHQHQAVGDLVGDVNPYNNPGNMYWYGLRATGKTAVFDDADANKVGYRVDLLGVSGHEDQPTLGATNVTAITGRHVQGWAFDAGTDIPLPHAKPLIHLGYAYGSGDDSTTGTDNSFRQTGLQGNFSRIGALSQNTDNYGTVLRPELSNIHIISAGVTMPVLAASDAGVIYRYYRLADTATSLVSSGVANTLNGVDKDLGQGVDVMFNMDVLKETTENIPHVQSLSFRSSLGFFRSGDAYGTASGETAVRGLVELKVGF